MELSQIEFRKKMWQKVESVLGTANPDTLREDYIRIVRMENMREYQRTHNKRNLVNSLAQDWGINNNIPVRRLENKIVIGGMI